MVEGGLRSVNVGDGQLWRQRLSSAVFADEHPTIISAPPAFGVSTIAAHLSSPELDEPAAVFDLKSANPERIGIDKLLNQHVVFISRETPELGHLPNAKLIDHSTLRFTEEEALEVALTHGVSPEVSRRIHLFTAGWPGYFTACLAAVRHDTGSDHVYDELCNGPHLDALIDLCTKDIDPIDLTQIAQLTHFTKISPGLVNALLGSGGLQRIQRAGLPIVQTQPGWYEILEPVRSSLKSRASLDEQTARMIAPELIADAGMVAGARILLAAGQIAAAAEALRSVPVFELDEGSQPTLLSLLRTVLDSEKDDGSLQLRLARVYHNHGDLVSLRQTLEDAVQCASEQLRPDLQLEAKAELLLLDLEYAPRDEVRSRLGALREQAKEHANAITQIRLREIAAMQNIEAAELDSIYTAAKSLESIANDWAMIGESARAAATLRMLTSRALSHLGAYAKAIDVLERACELSGRQPQSYVKNMVLLGHQHARLADAEGLERIDADIADLLSSSGLAWLDAYHTWSQMLIAGFQQDPTAVKSLQRRAESLMVKELLDHATGVIFLSQAAVAFANAGDHDEAAKFLARVVKRRDEEPLEVGTAEVLVAAQRGDAQCAQLLAALNENVEVSAERQWRLELAVNLALGKTDTGTLLDEARQYGLDSLYRATTECSRSLVGPRPVQLRLLGEFGVVTQDDELRKIGGGKATELVKFLGVRAKPVPTDVVIDHLWGNVGTDVGLRRLKNVVSRARSALGQEAIERRGQSVGLGAHVTSDLAEIHAFVRTLRANPDDLSTAVEIVDMYRGPLLELDVYHDWLQSERQSLVVAVESALEIAIDSGTVAATWAIDALTRLNPDSERPYMAVANLAARQKDEPTLRLALEHVRRVCIDLDIELPSRFEELADQVMA